MAWSPHAQSIERYEELLNSPKNISQLMRPRLAQPVDKVRGKSKSRIEQLIAYSGVQISSKLLVLVSFGSGALATVLTLTILPVPGWISIFLGIAVIYYPFSVLERRADLRALKFASDFPSILLATASSLSAGHTVLVAIERSTRLLPSESMVRAEIFVMLDALRTGSTKEIAISEFAKDIRLPELTLFRSAFLLSLESGGKLSPTLERLSQVLKDRSILISSARTATAVMRMTSNILVLFAPLIVGMVAIRTPNFLTTITTHPVASQIASIGVLLIALNCWILKRMSDFKP